MKSLKQQIKEQRRKVQNCHAPNERQRQEQILRLMLARSSKAR